MGLLARKADVDDKDVVVDDADDDDGEVVGVRMGSAFVVVEGAALAVVVIVNAGSC